MAQFGRPASDVAAGSWTTTPLWSKINEVVADDTSFITDAAAGGVAEVGLSSVVDPLSSTGHIIRVRAKRGASAGTQLAVALYQGATQIAAFTQASLTTAFVTYTFTLSGAQADAITDYTNLRFRLQGNTSSAVTVSWAEFEVPDTGTTVPLAASSAAGSGTLGLTAPTQVPLAAGVAAGSASLTVSLPAQMGLAAAAGAGSGSLTVVIPVFVGLAASSGAGSGGLQVSFIAQPTMSPSVAVGSGVLSLRAPALFSLVGSATGSATAAVSLARDVPLAAAVGSAFGSLFMGIPGTAGVAGAPRQKVGRVHGPDSAVTVALRTGVASGGRRGRARS